MKPLLLCTIALALLAGTSLSLQAGEGKSCCDDKAKGSSCSSGSAKSSCCAEKKIVKKADTSVKGATLLVRR